MDPDKLRAEEIHDRGYVFLNHDFKGILSRSEKIHGLPIYTKGKETLTILVESQGHVCFGPYIKDFKVSIRRSLSLIELTHLDSEFSI